MKNTKIICPYGFTEIKLCDICPYGKQNLCDYPYIGASERLVLSEPEFNKLVFTEQVRIEKN